MKEVKMGKKGVFVIFEGIDGSGTTTQRDNVASVLKSKNILVHTTQEPTNSIIGGLIRSWLNGDWSSTPECLQLLFSADRAYHLEKEVIPVLNKGIAVISDRYYPSTITYGMLDIQDKEWLRGLGKRFLEPDLVVYLQVSAKEAIGRIDKSRYTHLELFERRDKLARVVAEYDRLANENDHFITINGEQPEEKVTQDILDTLKDKLNLG